MQLKLTAVAPNSAASEQCFGLLRTRNRRTSLNPPLSCDLDLERATIPGRWYFSIQSCRKGSLSKKRSSEAMHGTRRRMRLPIVHFEHRATPSNKCGFNAFRKRHIAAREQNTVDKTVKPSSHLSRSCLRRLLRQVNSQASICRFRSPPVELQLNEIIETSPRGREFRPGTAASL